MIELWRMMLRLLSNILVLLILFVIASSAFAESDVQLFELKGDLPPLNLTFSDLKEFLIELEQLSEYPQNCTYSIAGPKGSISAHTLASLFDDVRIVSVATEFRVSCYVQNLRDFSISITASNSYREWSVRGTNRLRLESLRAHIEGFGQKYKTYWSGPVIQVVFFVFLMGGAAAWPLWLTSRLSRFFSEKTANATLIFFLTFSIFLFLGILSYDIPKWLFPGVAIYQGSGSFLQRYSVEISFWGIIITMAFSYYLYRRSIVPPPK